MSRYRRLYVPGGTYFFTVNLAHRGSDLLVRHVDVLREAVRVTRVERPFEVEAFVVMPDHLHAVWTLPEGDADFSVRWLGFGGRVGASPNLRLLDLSISQIKNSMDAQQKWKKYTKEMGNKEKNYECFNVRIEVP